MAITIAYLRVSTDKQTLENQRSEIKRFANTRNLNIDRWVEETVNGKDNLNNGAKICHLCKKFGVSRGTMSYSLKSNCDEFKERIQE